MITRRNFLKTSAALTSSSPLLAIGKEEGETKFFQYKLAPKFSPRWTWDQFNLLQFGPTSPVRFQKKNAEGWMKVDLRKGWIGINRVLFIKPKV